MIIPDEAWKYLHSIYGGIDVPRYSVELSMGEEGEKKEYMVEVFLKPL